ncbi:MAG: hypothetical protein COV72_06680 [Candidatus Omnitrophica bacterium CG11_big_fil_rev_8_21_14_0_20_42_13]|uniref:Uncharacterized protein n=1 Tax=Candidatus Ghiorseimicrobium undicola TaxID=1974746 RepID=A0A2H0LWH7_9BACT|nr:MAG: hypothetical protein COV72_06680 [Candidatus Omnitrophica bacterium CG11_big_fil_rev_8_21_14_0_20_42_13]
MDKFIHNYTRFIVKNKNFILCLSVAFVLFDYSNLWAERLAESETTIPFRPVDGGQGGLNPDTLFQANRVSILKESIKHDSRFFTGIMAYAAVRENDFTLCDNIDNAGICKKMAKDMMASRDLAEGKCEKMSSEVKLFCSNMNICDNLSGWQNNLCEAYNQGDLFLMRKAQSSSGFCREIRQGRDCDKWDESETREIIAAYQGFKYYSSKKACEKYTQGLEGHRAYICDVMFDTYELGDILDNIAMDIAYYMLAGQSKDNSICQNIKGEDLRTKCFSSSRKKFENFW